METCFGAADRPENQAQSRPGGRGAKVARLAENRKGGEA